MVRISVRDCGPVSHEFGETMPGKVCEKCKSTNPGFLSSCAICGAPLADPARKPVNLPAYLRLLGVLILSVMVMGIVVLPAIQYSGDFSRELSGTPLIPAWHGPPPSVVYQLNEPATDGSMEVTIVSAADGQLSYQSTKFFMVTARLTNRQDNHDIEVPGGSFELFDSRGTRYTPYGIASRLSYPLRPGESATVQLTYIITSDASGERIRFTFPAASATDDRETALFVLTAAET